MKCMSSLWMVMLINVVVLSLVPPVWDLFKAGSTVSHYLLSVVGLHWWHFVVVCIPNQDTACCFVILYDINWYDVVHVGVTSVAILSVSHSPFWLLCIADSTFLLRIRNWFHHPSSVLNVLCFFLPQAYVHLLDSDILIKATFLH